MPPNYYTQKQVADALGLTTRQVHNLTDAGMPREVGDGRPRYPWPAALRWYVDFKVQAEAAKQQPTDIDEWRRRKVAAEAEREELALAREKGESLGADVLQKVVGEIADRIRAVCINLPTTYGLELERVGVPADAAEAVLDQIGARVMESFRGVADIIEAVPYEDEAAEAAGDGDGSDPAA